MLSKLGRENEDTEAWVDGSNTTPDNTVHLITNYETHEEIIYHDESKDGEYDYGADWEGARQETLQAFFEWIKKEVLEGYECAHDKNIGAWLKKCKKANALRYNQGDAFFAQNFNTEVPATELGKSEMPFLMEGLKQAKREDKNDSKRNL